MRAAVVRGIGLPLEVEWRPDPTPALGQVVVEVGRCGICGSDLHMIDDPVYGRAPGDVMGHEYAGRVVALGPDVQRVRAGDLVSVVPFRSCGGCAACLAGEPAWCAAMRLEGGGYAEYALTHERQCVVLPQAASIADGAIVEPLAVALHGVGIAGAQAGKRVLVIGAGPIGLAVAFWARRMGATAVTMLDLSDAHRDIALALGATEFVTGDGAEADVLDGARGFDLIYECVGAPGLLARAIELARPRGTIVLLGLCTRPDSFTPFVALRKEVRILTSVFFTRAEYEAALDLLGAGDIAPRLLVTDTISLDATPDMFEALKHRRTHQCKVLIAPRAQPEQAGGHTGPRRLDLTAQPSDDCAWQK